MDCMVYLLQISIVDQLHTVFALFVHSVTNVALSNLKKALAKVKHGCPIWFGLLHPHSLLDTKGMLAALGVGENTKVLDIEPTHWKLICSNL